MAKTKTSRLSGDARAPLSEATIRRIREGGFVLVLACAVFLCLALGTWHLTDPGLLRTGGHVANAGGLVGAWLSDALYYVFGLSAWLVPAYAVWVAWLLLREKGAASTDGKTLLIFRTSGMLLLLCGGCGLLNLEVMASTPVHPFGAGGLLGQAVSQTLFKPFNPEGTVLVLLAFVFLGITWVTGLAWAEVAENVGAMTLRTVLFLRRRLRALGSMTGSLTERLHARRSESRALVREKTPPLVRAESVREKPVSPPLLPSVEPAAPAPVQSAPVIAPVAPVAPVIPPVRTPARPEKRAMTPVSGGLPPLSLLDKGEPGKPLGGYTHDALETLSRDVEQHLLDFGIDVTVVAVHPGPVITRFELQLAAGVKVSKLTALAKDLARSLSVISVRVVEVIPGKTVVGIELPNPQRQVVRLTSVLSADVYQQAHSPLTLALGVDIAGHPMVVDLAKMPHLLVAGTTGSGKSVGINAMILSLLFKATPEEVRLILVDPKMLELSVYDGIPHLLTPVVTDMKEAASALRWCVNEMERRYRLMASLGVRNIAGYNTRVSEAAAAGAPLKDPLWKPTDSMDSEAPVLKSLPYVVVVIDELADMMMVVGKKVEQLIARIAQKARAAGIHLILATQRPSVDVLTGLIKSNIPTRISFQVSSKIDSRTILDQQGAEQLLGHGDMLYLAPGTGAPLRVHGAFVDDREVHRIAEDWRARGEPEYMEDILSTPGDGEGGFGEESEGGGETDALYDQAVEFVLQTRKASISAVQRRFKIGYNRAARLVEDMERAGVVGPLDGGFRDVLVPAGEER
ncbi:cell division protein FtsK [Legionella geestiana]|uniref:DNA translocase FtsK n=1 Tax=Legionella geestiana TaxID=45065 RepID=A0A0W0TTJ3_9GAMM|nr:DNA translocase FtsK [Legionella geestiana]KTC98941.1 cell division protein FtsK [Legionella geestiana]QBS13030.1 DNA translocase FtsK [Legionella geestiana]QDQ39292.1 cell division protein FtsK [Legionella geestiana]STX54458.1 cell division protein FtsK [Legionella geestiana]